MGGVSNTVNALAHRSPSHSQSQTYTAPPESATEKEDPSRIAPETICQNARDKPWGERTI